MPLGDWQFWVVTMLAVIALGAVLRPFLPALRRRSRQERRVRLTIEKKKL